MFINKKISLGLIVYKLYYQPRGFLERLIHKGVTNTILEFHAKLQMEKATYHLKSVNNELAINQLEIHFLTGKKFWYQTCFCAYSMAQNTTFPLRPIIYDDGSLEKSIRTRFCEFFLMQKLFSSQK